MCITEGAREHHAGNWWHCNASDGSPVSRQTTGIILHLRETGKVGRDLAERLDDITLMLRISKTAKIDFTTAFLGHGREVLVSSREFPRNSFIARGALSSATWRQRAGYSHYRCNESN